MSAPAPDTQDADGKGAYYLHAIVPAAAQGWTGTGIMAGVTIEAVPAGRFAVLLSDLARVGVAAADFRAILGDPAGAADLAAAHAKVLARLKTQVPGLLPLPPCTIYPDLAPLRKTLARAEAQLSEAAAHIGGAAEWRVTVTVPKDGPGTAEPSLERLEAAQDHTLAETFDWLHTELSRHSRDCLRRTSGGERFDCVYLVGDGDAEAFAEEAERIRVGLARYGWEVTAEGPSHAASFLNLGL